MCLLCGEREREDGGGREDTGEGVGVTSFLALCMGIGLGLGSVQGGILGVGLGV